MNRSVGRIGRLTAEGSREARHHELLATGGTILRGQPFDEERISFSLRREFKEEEAGIRKAVRRADFRGDTDGSRAGRAKLMMLYNAMIQGDMEDDVPKWARDQLAIISQMGAPEFVQQQVAVAP